MTLLKLDNDIRKFNSLLLRIILALAVVLIHDFNKNFFAEEVYVAGFIGYWLLTVANLLLTPVRFKGLSRLILDLILIGIFYMERILVSPSTIYHISFFYLIPPIIPVITTDFLSSLF